jgi:hypothetical protein
MAANQRLNRREVHAAVRYLKNCSVLTLAIGMESTDCPLSSAIATIQPDQSRSFINCRWQGRAQQARLFASGRFAGQLTPYYENPRRPVSSSRRAAALELNAELGGAVGGRARMQASRRQW